MPYFRPLNKTAPEFDRNLPWPVHGSAYIAVWIGPISAGLYGGILTFALAGSIIGVVLGIAISLVNGCLSDRFLDRLIARHQSTLLQMAPRILINIAAFAWAFLLSAASMLAPILLLDRGLLPWAR